MEREVYLEHLRRDLERWVQKGWISPSRLDQILTDAAAAWAQSEATSRASTSAGAVAGRSKSESTASTPLPAPEQESRGGRMVASMFLLAGVLLAAGALSFIASNWQDMSRLARLALIVGGLWASGLFAVWLRQRAPARYAEGMFLLTAALFGGAMALVAQIFHISGDLPRFLLTWSLGALALSALMAAEWAGVLAVLVGLGWSLASTGADWGAFDPTRPFAGEVRVHWPFLLILVPAILLAMTHRWRWLARASVFAALTWAFASIANVAFGALAGLDYILLTWPLLGLLAALKGLFLRRLPWPETALFSPSLIWQGGLLAWFGLLALHWPWLLEGWRMVRSQMPPEVAHTAVPAFLFHAAAALTIGAALAGAALRRLAWWEAAVPVLLAAWLLLVVHVSDVEGQGMAQSWLVSKWTVFGMVLLFSLWLLGIGLAQELRGVWRLGLALFGLTVFWLYVITIGSLLNTAGFFLGAGLLLLVLAIGGWRFLRWVERQRAEPQGQGGAA